MSGEGATDPIAIIPARGTEPGLPKRNFKQVDGKPLIAHTVEGALASDALEEVYVSTESEALADVAREYGARVPFLRPERLAASDVLLHEVVAHTLDQFEAAGRRVTETTPLVVLQPNVPFRRPSDIDAALAAFDEGHEAVISAVEERRFYWRDRRDGQRDDDPTGELRPLFAERATRGGLEPLYRETGSINVTTPRLVRDGTRVGESPGYVLTDRLSAHTVDSVVDLWMAERIAEGPRVVFRVDGGDDIGMGHVSRCLTLASQLSERLRCSIDFVSDAAYPAGIDRIREAGFEVRAVPDASIEDVPALDPDIVFLDVLDTDPEAVRDLHTSVAAVFNLEDQSGGPDSADVVVNALYDELESDENHFAGPEYVVLREEFRDHDVSVPDRADRVLVTFGGSDPAGLSVRASRAIVDDGGRTYRLVLGPDFDRRRDVADLVSDAPHVSIVEAAEEMGAHMAWADLAVASGGRTVFELAATGTPALVVAQNDREHDRMSQLADRGLVAYLGHESTVDAAEIRDAIDDLATDPERRRRLSDRGQTLVDGDGTRRILDLVSDILLG